jgi:protein-disulfide isomerase
LFAIGLVIDGAARPAILRYAASDVAASQALVSQPASSKDSAPQQSIVTTLPAEQEAALTEIDQTQINPDAPDTFQGMPVGFTQEGHPYLGYPEAPVTIEEYSDCLCPFCSRHFDQTVPTLIEKYVQTDQVKYVFRDMPLVGLHPTAPVGHLAARCLSKPSTAYFWAMHHELFARQNEWSPLPDPSPFLALYPTTAVQMDGIKGGDVHRP